MICINRLNKAMHRIDPNGEIYWYVGECGGETVLQGELYYNGTSVQSQIEIYRHSISYDHSFQIILDRLLSIKKELKNLK